MSRSVAASAVARSTLVPPGRANAMRPDDDAAAAVLDEPHHGQRGNRFPGTRFADDGDRLAAVDVKGKVANRGDDAVRGREFDRQPVDGEDRSARVGHARMLAALRSSRGSPVVPHDCVATGDVIDDLPISNAQCCQSWIFTRRHVKRGTKSPVVPGNGGTGVPRISCPLSTTAKSTETGGSGTTPPPGSRISFVV